tara:strand:+ start:353 stop:628 length:276 start_codon:yes stop_codon:yes gene_type:complete
MKKIEIINKLKENIELYKTLDEIFVNEYIDEMTEKFYEMMKSQHPNSLLEEGQHEIKFSEDNTLVITTNVCLVDGEPYGSRIQEDISCLLE